MKRTIVTILSTNYSGSHYLSLLLGSNSGAVHIGEVHHLAKTLRKNKIARQECHLCESSSCELFRGVDTKNIDNLYEIIFSNVDPGVTTLIDTSKMTKWAARFLDNEQYNMKYIHLVRDPRALVRRWSLANSSLQKKITQKFRTARRLPAHSFGIILSAMTDVYAYRWLYENRQITNFIDKHGLDHKVVSYCDLTTYTDLKLRETIEWIGLEYEPEQIAYWNFRQHGGQRINYEWIRQQGVTNYSDMRWKSFLTARQQDRIANNPHLNNYLSGINLRFTDNGLTGL